MNQGVMVGGRRPLVEDDLRWKTTSVGRRPLEKPLVEDDLRWKMTFSGRQPLVEDDLRFALLNSAALRFSNWHQKYWDPKNFVSSKLYEYFSPECCLVLFAAFLVVTTTVIWCVIIEPKQILDPDLENLKSSIFYMGRIGLYRAIRIKPRHIERYF